MTTNQCMEVLKGIEGVIGKYLKDLIFKEWECGYSYNFYDDFKKGNIEGLDYDLPNSALLTDIYGNEKHSDVIKRDLALAIMEHLLREEKKCSPKKIYKFSPEGKQSI